MLLVTFLPSSELLVDTTSEDSVLVENDCLSPSTPPEKLASRVSSSTGLWSSSPLELAANNNIPSELSEASARRSLRQKKKLQGFKTSPCSSKNCLGCSLIPPTIPLEIIKNLGASFFNIDVEKLSDENLAKRKKNFPPGGSKLSKKRKALRIIPMMTHPSRSRRSQRNELKVAFIFSLAFVCLSFQRIGYVMILNPLVVVSSSGVYLLSKHINCALLLKTSFIFHHESKPFK